MFRSCRVASNGVRLWCRGASLPEWPRSCSHGACGWHWYPGMTMGWRCVSCISSRRGHRTFGSRFRSPSIDPDPRCRRFPHCPSRPVGSSGSSATSSGSSRSTIPNRGAWSCTSIGRRIGSRCDGMPDPLRPWPPAPSSSPLSRSPEPASTRSRSGRCMPGSSSPAISASGWWAKRSSG